MGTYAPNFSPRWRGKYRAAGIEHTLQLRRTRGSSAASVINLAGAAHDLFNNWVITLADDFAWISAEYALTDSDVFIPTANPFDIVGTIAVSNFSPMQKIAATTHSGRTAHSRARYSLYGIQWHFNDKSGGSIIEHNAFDGIVTPAENAAVHACKVLADGVPLAGGSGEAALWYDQVTVKPNDYLWRKVRKGLIT